MSPAQAAERRASHQRVFTNAALVGVLATGAKLAGAAKVMVTARYFGAGDQLDAFVIAFLLPAFFTDIVARILWIELCPRHSSGCDPTRETQPK